MAVGTQATVKGLDVNFLEQSGVQVVLGNTYHLELRPGSDVIERLGGLHRFSGWSGPMLTDSGGFQVFSLKNCRTLDEKGVTFKSHLDGSLLEMTPESSIGIQNKLGADIIMAFDECPALPCEDKVMEQSIERTGRWLKRCVDAHSDENQQLFGIVQGGLSNELRLKSLELTLQCELPGLAIGGLSVGETRIERLQVLQNLAPHLPEHMPHYLMGVGTPLDIVESVAQGIDMFDCVLPTREGRHGVAYTSLGKVRIRNRDHQLDESPLDPDCSCLACQKYSRAYLRHLFSVDEMLGPILLSQHNLTYYIKLMSDIRKAIKKNRLLDLLQKMQTLYLEKK